jgi:hypothetical protein
MFEKGMAGAQKGVHTTLKYELMHSHKDVLYGLIPGVTEESR